MAISFWVYKVEIVVSVMYFRELYNIQYCGGDGDGDGGEGDDVQEVEDDQSECHGDRDGDHDDDDQNGDHGDGHDDGDHGDGLLRDGGSPSTKRKLVITLKSHVWFNSSL